MKTWGDFMKYISMEEFLSFDKLKRIRILKQIAAGAVRVREERKDMGRVNVIETRVKEILANYPNTRENDHCLYITYLEEYHYINFNKDNFVNYEQYGLPSFKSIERARRKIQNEQCLYKASEGVEEGRREAEKEYRENYKG